MLSRENITPEPFSYHSDRNFAFQKFEVSGDGDKGDIVTLATTRLFDLEIEGSIHPFKWDRDGTNAITLTLTEKWQGYMLIPVIGHRDR